MPHHVLKPRADEDFYVEYSTIVDSPVAWGTRAEMLAERDAIDAERLDRADEHGTSAMWLSPPAFGWHDEAIQVREYVDDPTRPSDAWGEVRRADLRAFCETARDGAFHPAPGMVTWTPHEMEHGR